MNESEPNRNLAKDEKTQLEQQKLESQLKELNDKLNLMMEQFNTVILPEEESANDTYQNNYKKFEKLLLQYREMQMELNISKARADEAQKKSKAFMKQMNALKAEIDKIRKKLGLEELYQEKSEKEFIIFKKDNFKNDEGEIDSENIPDEENEGKKDSESKKKRRLKGKNEGSNEKEDNEKSLKDEKRRFFSKKQE